MNFTTKSNYSQLLWKTVVFLNVICGPEISIEKYVEGKFTKTTVQPLGS